MPEYKIDCGNSTDGPIGFVAYVTARTKRAAIKKLSQQVDGHRLVAADAGGVDCGVYFNTDNIKLSDVTLAD
jgi:hypothetical protein